MKSKTTQRRFKAQKRSSCPMCKPYKRGWEGKRTIGEVRRAVDADQQLREI